MDWWSGSIRDSLHGQIKLTKCEKAIMDTALFQRLKWIGQCSGMEQVYDGPGNRFRHSLGVLYLAGKYAEHLYPNDPIQIQIIRLAGMLHDIAHGPFSHAFDKSVYSLVYGDKDHGHDKHRLILLGKNQELVNIFEKFDIDASKIKDIWMGRDRVGEAVIQGPIDADRLDYIPRDAQTTGTIQTGMVSCQRIIENSIIVQHPTDGRDCLGYKQKVVDDITKVLFTRFNMYQSVYTHKTAHASKTMIESMMNLIADELIPYVKDAQSFYKLTDCFVKHLIHQKKDAYPKSFKLMNDLFTFRRLPKLVGEIVLETDKALQLFDCLSSLIQSPMEKYKTIESIIDEANDSLDENNWISICQMCHPDNLKEPSTFVATGAILSVMDLDTFDKKSVFVLTKFGNRLLTFGNFLNKAKFLSSLVHNNKSFQTVRIFSYHSHN